jgi:hypothetical protein
MAWDYQKNDMVDDNAIGRVRTAVFLPDYHSNTIPKTDLILAALKKGSCVVTDGPLLELSLTSGGQVANLGEVLLIEGDEDPEIHITAYTTPEFGPITQVEIIAYFKGQKKKTPICLKLEVGKQSTIKFNGLQGYCRVQGQSMGVDGERFCCFSNPIWFRVSDGMQKTFHVNWKI